MQVSKIASYYAPKTLIHSQVRRANPVSFGEEVWIGGGLDCQTQRNNKVNDFFAKAETFKEKADSDIKLVKKLAKIAFAKGKNAGFEDGYNNYFELNNNIYEISCRKNESGNIMTLENFPHTFTFVFDEDAQKMPKEYFVRYHGANREYTVEIKPDETIYKEYSDDGYNKKSITYAKEGYTYEETYGYGSSQGSKMAVIRNFPNRSKSQYIEFNPFAMQVDKDVYSYDPKTKNWIRTCS